MGGGDKASLQLQFNPKVRLEFHGSTITSDAGLLPLQELDEALGLTSMADYYICCAGPFSAGWLATTIPTMLTAWPKTRPCE